MRQSAWDPPQLVSERVERRLEIGGADGLVAGDGHAYLHSRPGLGPLVANHAGYRLMPALISDAQARPGPVDRARRPDAHIQGEMHDHVPPKSVPGSVLDVLR